MGFWLIAVIVVLITVVFGILYSKYDEMWQIIISVTCGVFAVMLILGGIICSVEYPRDINTFIQQKTYIESHIPKSDVEDAALTTKKIELNTWLYDNQYIKQKFGSFSLCPESVINLTPIK